MRAADPGDRFALYAACRLAIEMLAPVDSFYIALIREHDQMTVFPYTFHNGLAVAAEVLPYGSSGLTAWILISHRTYRFKHDHGALINRGYAVGDASELSSDAIVVPVFDDDGHVAGLMAALSSQPAIFTDEHAAALECLADALSDTRRTTKSDRLGQLFPELAGDPHGDDSFVNLVSEGLTRIHQMLTPDVDSGAKSPVDRLSEAADLCLRLQAQIAELAAAHRDPLETLTARELEIAQLLMADPRISNQELADRLHLSEATIKTHVSRVLVKTGSAQRGELRHLSSHRPQRG